MVTKSECYTARRVIDHGCDGPITPFVLVARACELAAKGHSAIRRETVAEAAANALHDALTEYGWLNEGLVETGT